MKLKFKSGINKVLLILVAIFNLIILLLFTTKYFTVNNFGLNIGLFLFAIDIIVIIPMLFCTYYEFRDDYLYIHDYPIRAYKIKYEDIFNVEDGDFEAKNKSVVALSMNRVAIGYKKTFSDDSVQDRYIFVSPAEMSLFLVKLGGKLEKNKEIFEEKAKILSEKQAEHNKKKKIADEKKAEIEQENAPEIIKVSGVKKFDGFVVENEADKTEKPDTPEQKK